MWSDSAQEWGRDCAWFVIEHASRDEAERDADDNNKHNMAVTGAPTDWRPVHCREVVIDG